MKKVIIIVIILVVVIGGYLYYKNNEVDNTMKNQTDNQVSDNSGFQVKSDSSQSSSQISTTEKQLVAQALINRQTTFSSGDVTKIRDLYSKIMSSPEEVAKMSDADILAIASHDSGLIKDLDARMLADASVKWEKTDTDVVQLLVPLAGKNRLFSARLVDGVWY